MSARIHDRAGFVMSFYLIVCIIFFMLCMMAILLSIFFPDSSLSQGLYPVWEPLTTAVP